MFLKGLQTYCCPGLGKGPGFSGPGRYCKIKRIPFNLSKPNFEDDLEDDSEDDFEYDSEDDSFSDCSSQF